MSKNYLVFQFLCKYMINISLCQNLCVKNCKTIIFFDGITGFEPVLPESKSGELTTILNPKKCRGDVTRTHDILIPN